MAKYLPVSLAIRAGWILVALDQLACSGILLIRHAPDRQFHCFCKVAEGRSEINILSCDVCFRSHGPNNSFRNFLGPGDSFAAPSFFFSLLSKHEVRRLVPGSRRHGEDEEIL